MAVSPAISVSPPVVPESSSQRSSYVFSTYLTMDSTIDLDEKRVSHNDSSKSIVTWLTWQGTAH